MMKNSQVMHLHVRVSYTLFSLGKLSPSQHLLTSNDRLSFSPGTRTLTVVKTDSIFMVKGKRPMGTSFMDPSSVALSFLLFVVGVRLLDI